MRECGVVWTYDECVAVKCAFSGYTCAVKYVYAEVSVCEASVTAVDVESEASASKVYSVCYSGVASVCLAAAV